ncbi:hypothetical protein TNCV_2569951 [Trichonephila clavipes]|nr:hypothetical protein TNCV_2569951 [Trichonephila clavipes]
MCSYGIHGLVYYRKTRIQSNTKKCSGLSWKCHSSTVETTQRNREWQFDGLKVSKRDPERPHVVPFAAAIGDFIFFMQYNDRNPTVRLVKNFPVAETIQCMEWLARSPYLKLIQHV